MIKKIDKKIKQSLLDSKVPLIKFGVGVYSALVENFSQTFFVGGMVRDLLLRKPITDVDIATEALPAQIENILQKANINYSEKIKNLGIVTAQQNNLTVEIATFRTESYGSSRYPKVQFISSAQTDSQRRDFSVNALYFSLKRGEIYDYQEGLTDIAKRTLRFIGSPKKRITEDPLRIIRALRFALDLKLRIEKKSFAEIKNGFSLLNNLTRSRMEKEIKKSKNEKILARVINNPQILDKYFN